MLDTIIKFSIKNKLIIGAFVVALIGWGVYSAQQLPIDALPDITNNQVQVITTAPSQSAQDIERLVTFPIEMTMSNIPEVEEIRSFSRFGLSVVTVVFKDHVDIYWARQQINERLSEAKSQIPDGVGTPEMMPVTTGLGEIYQYTLQAKKGYEKIYDAMELRTIQDWIVRRQLLGIEGVADVSTLGGFLKQYEIALEPDKLLGLGVSINEVFEALEKNNQNTGGAYIDKNPKAFFIRSEGLIGGIEDIKHIAIKNTENGTPILVRDVGKVQLGNAVRYGAMTYNDTGEVVGAIVMMLKGANSSKVINRVKERIEQIQKSLPEGVVIKPFLDRTKLVDKAISTVTTNLIEGALIVIFILVLLLGNLRAGLIVASIIPLAMLFAISLMNLFGVSGNLMSLGAIDFGIIVDGSVIIVEATLHYLGLKKSGSKLTQSQMDDEVYESASKIRTSAAFGEIIILIVYLPILALVGIEGKMFRPMALTVSFAILGAFILSLTYVPMMSALFLKKTINTKATFSDKIIKAIQSVYTPVLDFVLNNRKIVLVSAILIFVLSLFTFNKMGSEFIPSLDEGDFATHAIIPSGSSVNQTVDVVGKTAEVLLREFPDEVIDVVGKIGSSEIPTDPMPMEVADVMIMLHEPNKWTKAKSRDELADKMQHTLEDNIVGVAYGFMQPIQMRFNELMTGARQDVVLKVYGEDLDKLVEYGNQIGEVIPTVEGAVDLYLEKLTGLKQIVVDYNRKQLALYGLNVSDVNTAINTAFAGKSAGLVYEGEKRFDLVVRLDKESRGSIEDVRKLYVTTSNGAQIPLSSVANVSFKTGPKQIQRDDAKRRITIGFNVRGRDIASIVEELKTKIDSKVNFAPGYYVTYGGTFKNLEEARNRLSIAVPVALLLIFLLLFITFKSIKHSILIFTAIPMSAIGGIFALWFRGMPFSISAGIGFIALFGVAVLNGIVLIAEFNRLKKQGMTNLKDIIKKGTSVRLRPVIMTAMVASLGFLPMALATSAGAEVQKPLATVVIGGLVSATVLTLVILPILYYLFERKSFSKLTPKVASIIIVLIGLTSVNAQQERRVIPLELTESQVVKMALSNSIALKKAALNITKQEAGVKGALQLAPFSIGFQSVQVDKFMHEKEFQASQNFGSFLLNSKRKSLAKEKVKYAEALTALTKKDIIKKARSLYQKWHYLYALRSVISEQQESVNEIKSISKKLYEAGEIGGLQRDLTALQSLGVESEQSNVYKQLVAVENDLKELLQIKKAIVPKSNFPKQLITSFEQDSISKTFTNVMKQREDVVVKQISVAKSAYFPQLSAGIVNRQEGNQKAYTGFNVGINFPLPFGANSANIKKQNVLKQEVNYDNTAQEIMISNRHENLKNQLLYLDSELQNLSTISSKAQKFLEKLEIAYKAGEIDAYQYNHSFEDYFQVMENYLSLINTYNQTVIYYEYFTKEY